jgi:hypothetical protein
MSVPMMAITTKSSTSVKPAAFDLRFGDCVCMMAPEDEDGEKG